VENNPTVNLTLEVPDELARTLEGIAATRHMSIQQLAIERLGTLTQGSAEPVAGSAAALLRVMAAPPHLSSADVDDLDSAISAGRLPVRSGDLF
jgi:hypothetical protein